MSFRTEPVMSKGKVRRIMSELSFAALRCRFQTGRSYVISGEGRNRVYGYRTGVHCDLGDIERAEWADMVRELIQQKGEQKLHQQLLQHLKDHNYAKESKADWNLRLWSCTQTGYLITNSGWISWYLIRNIALKLLHLPDSF